MRRYEIKIGFHWRGESYPTHNFEGVGDTHPEGGVIMRSNEELREHLEGRWRVTPNRAKLMYFYIQPHTTGFQVEM